MMRIVSHRPYGEAALVWLNWKGPYRPGEGPDKPDCQPTWGAERLELGQSDPDLGGGVAEPPDPVWSRGGRVVHFPPITPSTICSFLTVGLPPGMLFLV